MARMYRNNRWHSVTKEELENAVKTSRSATEIIKKVGASPGGTSVAHLKRLVKEYSIDTSHIKGQAWGDGSQRLLSADQVLVKGRSFKRHQLLRAMTEKGVPYECALCGVEGTWNGKPLTLEIHHIDGDAKNNTLGNLQCICPNCHSQTENHGYKGKHRSTRNDPDEWAYQPRYFRDQRWSPEQTKRSLRRMIQHMNPSHDSLSVESVVQAIAPEWEEQNRLDQMSPKERRQYIWNKCTPEQQQWERLLSKSSLDEDGIPEDFIVP